MATDIKVFKAIAEKMPPAIAMLMRGPTGIGKSHVARDVAKALDLPYIDVRGSTMDEAGVGGIPDLETSKTHGVATFCLPSWYVRACKTPCVLMLDELNRSMPQVMQSFFQIVLDRELGNNSAGEAMSLHPETRVFAAVNYGSEYDVNDMDPALLRRFAVFDLVPDVDSWLEWAEGTQISTATKTFIRNKPKHFWVDPAVTNPGDVIPTPASWDRLDMALQHMGYSPDELAGSPVPGMFYPIAMSMVGVAAAAEYAEFIASWENRVSAMDVLTRFDSVSAKIDPQNAGAINALIDELALDIFDLDNELEEGWVDNLEAFTKLVGAEMFVRLWCEIMRVMSKKDNDFSSAEGKRANMLRQSRMMNIHKKFGPRVVELGAEIKKLGKQK